MGSRRLSRPPSFGNGRSSSGEESSGRSTGCSYLSNVRPETRSTLCSMMAQLTEETQPTFETTLKSKAVSEKCNVKFSCVVTGHPVPQVIWYKDDMQLDRYCGLPKYEIFRNGQSHSLHIYDCTVDDAAIYQASASNSKGIATCSGVLEVGEMNEFKIHQRYFGKLKQKADNRRKEAEGKENQEPLRTISPDRTLRKRRSTMESYLSTPSSTEDEGSEESHEAVVAETEVRLQEAPVEEAEEKPVPITNGAVPALTNGQAVSENANKSGTYFYDPTQKIFTAHQPKIPFIKKKIKISNSAKIAKAETPTERVLEEKPNKDGPSSLAPASTEPLRCEVPSEEVMEVENTVSSSVVDAVSSEMIDLQKTETETVLHIEKPPKDENACVEATMPSKNKKITEVSTSSCIVSGTDGKQASKQEKEAEIKHMKERVEKQNQSAHIPSTPLQTRAAAPQQPLSTAKKDISKTGHVAVMEVDEKSNASPVAPLTHRDSVNAPCEARTAFPQSPCEQTRDQLSDKETSRCQNAVSVSQPAQLSEVKQAHTPMTRNDAPVNLEPPLNRHRTDTPPPPPQNTHSGRDTSTDDIQSPSLNGGPQAAIDKMTQDTRDHSRGSNESHTVLFTDLQKSPLQIPGGGENTRGCNVSPSRQQNQVDTAIKAVEGTEIQVRKEVEGRDADRLLEQSPDEKVVEMETESTALQVTEQTEGKHTTDAVEKDIVIVDEAKKGMEKNEDIVQMVEDANSELQKLKSNTSEHTIPSPTKPPENITTFQMNDFQEIQKPVTKIISIAELLRSIKALDSLPANSESTTPSSPETREVLQEADNKSKPDKKPTPTRNCGTDERPPKNIKETLMEIYNQLNLADQKQNETLDSSSPPAQALQKPPVTPQISVVDAGPVVETAGLQGKKNSGDVRDNYQEPRASTLTTDCTTVPLSGVENVKHGYSPSGQDELTKTSVSEPGTPSAVTPTKASHQEPKVSVLELAKDVPVQDSDVGVKQTISPEIQPRSKTERASNDQLKIEEQTTTTDSLQSVQKFPNRTGHDADTQGNHLKQHSNSSAEEFSRTNSFTIPTPEASPLLKRRNCASPIPSATAQELASGARRKILTPKAKPDEAPGTSPVSLSVSPSLSRKSPLLQPPAEQSLSTERRSPLLNRRRMTSDGQTPIQPPTQDIHSQKTEGKPAEMDKHDPFKAPQVIRKIRSETFADASGHLKLWCQFFNILSDCTLKWYKNEMEIAQMKRSAGDETQVNLAIVQASSKDAGVYGCTITNEYGTDSTDCLLSADILAGLSICEDLGVGEEIEMTPMIFSKGVADSGTWGNKFFGRIMVQESRIGDGCSHKVWRAKVIYGLEPVFESGNTCIIKACNPIAYGGKGESCLIERNLDIIKQECKIQNLAREYCKIFSTEARVIENFGPSLEVLPVYLMYRPANTVPYATVEADLSGVYQKYCSLDQSGSMDARTGSPVEQKCCALQHWIFQWTSGNLLLTRLEGVETKITNVGISVKSTGHQGLPVEGSPKVFEQFISQHQCNYFCGLLGLRSLKIMDSLLTPAKPKASKSPLLQRKMAGGSSSPQTGRKAAGSPRMPRKNEQEGRNTPTKQKSPKVVQME